MKKKFILFVVILILFNGIIFTGKVFDNETMYDEKRITVNLNDIKKTDTKNGKKILKNICERLFGFYYNIQYPKRFITCLFQQDLDGAKYETKQFFINVALDVASLIDKTYEFFKMDMYNKNIKIIIYQI